MHCTFSKIMSLCCYKSGQYDHIYIQSYESFAVGFYPWTVVHGSVFNNSKKSQQFFGNLRRVYSCVILRPVLWLWLGPWFLSTIYKLALSRVSWRPSVWNLINVIITYIKENLKCVPNGDDRRIGQVFMESREGLFLPSETFPIMLSF